MKNLSHIPILRILCFATSLLLFLPQSVQTQTPHVPPAVHTALSDRDRHLIQAVKGRDRSRVTLLLDQGANVNVHDTTGKTPLQWVMDDTYDIAFEMMKLLRRRGATVDLVEAAMLGESETVRKLLEFEL